MAQCLCLALCLLCSLASGYRQDPIPHSSRLAMRKPLAPNSLAVQHLVQLLRLPQLPMTVLRPRVSRRSF